MMSDEIYSQTYDFGQPIKPRDLHEMPTVDVFGDERDLKDQSGHGRDLVMHWAAEDLASRLVEQMQKNGMLHAFTDTVSAVAANAPAYEPAYEPLELVCGSYSASERPQRYLLADVRRWANGDFDGLHSTPREVIATLAETVRALLLESTQVPLPATFAQGVEWGRWPATGPYVIMTAIQVWVQLNERHKPVATEGEIAARLEGLRPWMWAQSLAPDPIKVYGVRYLERWARGDQRDLRAAAVTAMRALAGEVLRLAGLEE